MTQPTGDHVCYRHPDRPTVLSCSHCGRPICPACSIDASVGQRCPECVRTEGTQRVIRARETMRRPSFATAPVTLTIIVVAVGIEVLGFLGADIWRNIFEAFAMWPPGVEAGEWWRMITVVFLHAGLIHLGFNMLITYQIGPMIERQLGSLAFASLFAATAAAGSAFAFFFGPDVAGVGASGAVFGLVGTLLAAAVRRRETAWGRNVLRQMAGLLILNAAIPFFIPRVAWEAHLGGVLAGFLIGWLWLTPGINKSEPLRVVVALVVLAASIGSTFVL